MNPIWEPGFFLSEQLYDLRITYYTTCETFDIYLRSLYVLKKTQKDLIELNNN